MLTKIKKDIIIYILLCPALLVTFIFAYLPMPGIFVAFQDFNIFKGFVHSPFVGFKHIEEFLHTPKLMTAVRNTLEISVLNLLVGFPVPIILALLFNELRNGVFKRVIQTVSYLPYFLSWISVIGIFTSFYALYGPLNDLRVSLFGHDTERILFLAKQSLFIPNILFLGIWKEAGWGSVIYLAAITSIDSALFEASAIDGANKLQQIRYITIPGIMPTIVILLILNISGLFGSNFELVYGLKNAFIDFDVISTVVYSYGIQNGNYSLAAAIGFMEGLIAFLLIMISNFISKKITQVGIW